MKLGLYIVLCASLFVQAKFPVRYTTVKYIDCAPLVHVTSIREFDAILRRYKYVIAYFYGAESTHQEQVKGLLIDAFHDEQQDFCAARVKFIAIDDTAKMRALWNYYNLVAGSDALLFFVDRKSILQQMVSHNFGEKAFNAFMNKTKLDDYVDHVLIGQELHAQKRQQEKSDFCCKSGCGRYCSRPGCHWKEGYDWQYPYAGYYYGQYWTPYWGTGGPPLGYQSALG